MQHPATDIVSATQVKALSAAMAPLLAQQSEIASEFAATMLPNLDVMLPKMDLTGYVHTQELVRAITLPHLDWFENFNKQWASQILAQIPRFTMPALPTLNVALPEGLFDVLGGIDWDALTRRSRVPSNWPIDFEEQLPALVEIVNVEGIPLAWVPRASLVEQLLAAASADERSALLIAHRDEIIEECLAWVSGLDDEFIAPQLPIAKKVLAACQGGHWEVAAISAVAVVHAVVESLRWASDRQRVQKHHQLTLDLPLSKLFEQATRAPLVLFYDDWDPRSGKPRPVHLTRHVVTHRLAEDQVTARNCVVAVMLMASLLVSVEQLELGHQEFAA